ncbi:MAG TPA: FG-GAP-like repeat-containing protein [Candidatus Moranbacteria bacterium]|nr:FG-GAP-like repeat-containing protein [Candidatus Moranbacteria bacterium]
MLIVDKKRFIAFCSILTVVAVGFFGFLGYYFWNMNRDALILENNLKNFSKAGEEAAKDLKNMPAMRIEKQDDKFVMTDDTSDGISIKYNKENGEPAEENEKKEENKFQINFPEDYQKPIEVKLDAERTITILDNSKDKAKTELLSNQETIAGGQETRTEEQKKYLSYETSRKKIIYAYQKDQATGEKKLKNWILYSKGSGEEKESYTLQNAKIKKNAEGEIEVFYFGQKEMQSQQAAAEVAPSLLERAQRTLAKEMGEDILNSGTPDFVIPKPYFLDKNGNRTDLEWTVGEDDISISIDISIDAKLYPLAVDPTLSFTAPGQSNSGNAITGEASSQFGYSMTAGDFNADGKVDLAVGSAGRTYIFYSGSIITENATGADVTITGETGSYFGCSMAAGDFNADGKTDLAVGASWYSSYMGYAYIFYNDGSIPTTAATADAIIYGQGFNDYFGGSMTAGDFNADGKTDLAIGATGYSSNQGRAYIFYNGSIITENASGADIIITGVNSAGFGNKMASGDLNADGKIDLIVSEQLLGKVNSVYVFYGGSIITENASGADAIMTGLTPSSFWPGFLSIITGDFNADGKTDLAIGESTMGASAGSVYIFYNGSITTENFSGADIAITGEADSYLGSSMTSGDFNADGKTDLAVGSNAYRAHIFYNDGSIPATAATADVIITGEASSRFGFSMTAGDFNADGKTDLAVGANFYSSNTGRAYIFYSQNGQVNTNFKITGESSSALGISMTAGDFNADGETDLAVGAHAYSSSAGRVYIFYGDGSIPTTAATADIVITGESSSTFGFSMTAGDFNADGKTDLAVGGYAASSSAGRAYIFYNGSITTKNASSADVIITGESSSNLGISMTAGDFNADGETDLAVGAHAYSSSAGRVYIFYGDGSIPTTAATADIVITGESSSTFGFSMTAGDFNADGKTDLAVGGYAASSSAGRAYIFYNGSIITENASDADIIITGESSSKLGASMATGDFNADGKTDLAVGAHYYSSQAGRAYIFYNGSITTENATGADVIITGEALSGFSGSMTSGDFNADGKTDLAVGSAGRAYIFYNGSIITENATGADVIITGEVNSYFGHSMTSGDFNADGRTDLAVGAAEIMASTAGTVYIYETRENYAWQLQPQKSIRTSPISGQEIKITGEASSYFGYSMTAGDFNTDGKTDLAVSSDVYSTNKGRVYIFYNDGLIPVAATTADAIITGENNNYYFGYSMTKGDFNSDGKIDLVVGTRPSSAAGRAYIFYNDGTYPTTTSSADFTITGSAGDYFGTSMISGDFNADGTTDLAVGSTGDFMKKAYVFYNDGSIPTTAATADAIITGAEISNFGSSFGAGDFNVDGKIDLAVAESSNGNVYIFYNGSITTESYTGADVSISGFSVGGISMTVGDFNADGKDDLAVGTIAYIGYQGRAYIFYGGSIITENATGADVIIETGTGNVYFGSSMVASDFNADGRIDLAVGSYGYSSYVGRAYIFYNDGSIPSIASNADVIITGETGSYLGWSMASGDFNADGEIDLAVGAYNYDIGSNTNEGQVYLYTFNDPVLTGDASSNLGISMISGDLNADGKTDLVVGANAYSSNTGRAYVFYNDRVLPSTVATADAIITGEASSGFGSSMTAGDFNFDGKIDLAVGAILYSSNAGRAYIFYNGSIITENASAADIIITGEASSYFGSSMTAGDFNTDGKIDLTVGAIGYSSNVGRAYIFYNGSIITENATGADIIITGEALGEALTYFSYSMTAGDLNADGKTDLVVGSNAFSSSTGRVYIFYNGSIITENASDADVIISGESSSFFGSSMTTGDFNADSKTDLAVGASTYSSNAGRAYIFLSDGSIPTTAATADVIITGEALSLFGSSMTAGDFNADGKTDLVVGSHGYSTNTGRAYVFYNSASFPSSAASADLIFTGETTNNYFGSSLAAGDFNADGKTDLAIGAYGYSSSAGRFYVYSMESKTGPLTKIKARGTSKYRGNVRIK